MARQGQFPQRSQTRPGQAAGRPQQQQQQQQQRRRASVADSATREDQCHPRKIFVGGLDHKTTTQGLRDHFKRYGAIVDAVVLRWPDGRSRGFGYVSYAELAAATAALQETHQIAGREVDVKRAVPGTNKLFVGGLPQNTAAAELRQHFESFGVVSDAVVMIDPSTNRSRGFGFVCFLPGQEGAAAVSAALDQYQNHRIRGKWIEVKSAAPPHKVSAKGSPDGSPTSAEAEEAAAISAPRPDRQHLAAPPGLSQVHQSAAEHEPQKVAMFSTAFTSAAEACAVSAAPPGLRVPGDPANAAGSWGPEFGHRLQARAYGHMAAPAHLSWHQGYAPDKLGAKPSPTAPGGMWNVQNGGAKDWSEPVKVRAPAQVEPSTDGYFDASRDLQRSLEQLLRMQSEQVTEKLSDEPMLLPSVLADDISTTKLER